MIIKEIVDEDPEFLVLVEKCEAVYNSPITISQALNEACQSEFIFKARNHLEEMRKEVAERSKSSTLWMN